jgi:SAM-dependent methyltransferase
VKCRNCNEEIIQTFADLGSSPPSNAYLSNEQLNEPEHWYPLVVKVCTNCWLVQTEDFASRETFFNSDYAYFSTTSTSWVEHARNYCETLTQRLGLDHTSHVVEVASNDGYLLQHFQNAGIPNLGIEPTLSVAVAARSRGIESVVEFFCVELAEKLADEGLSADLMVANNVLAHVPDIRDFAGGFVRLLKPTGVATFEFPHLCNLVEHNQFDTIYHEHFSYLTATSVAKIFEAVGLQIFDIEKIRTHGGSLRVFAQRSDACHRPVAANVCAVLDEEQLLGVATREYYSGFQPRVETAKNEFWRFLLDAKASGKKVAAYGAAAKGNTLVNYSGIRPDLISYVVDLSPGKMGKFMPGSRIPIVAEKMIEETRPDYLVIFPWNIADEIAEQLSYCRDWNCTFVKAIPSLEMF